ncbi:MAG: hypothetical protein RI841_04335 [Halomonas sp.]|uniref:hypothetical protein n=1 Tax=Halomonas sp. TaxID=1486246 RepID=UPI00286FBFB6|nr:hypothetical protein [Halomonas sp.]MDR9438714.1 hypothetical protein [Halomonas sp.]
MALLLAVLLSVTSLAGHAAMDACATDCTATQVEMIDHADADCSACATMAESPLVANAHPDTLVGISSPAVVEYIPLPPRQPPRP